MFIMFCFANMTHNKHLFSKSKVINCMHPGEYIIGAIWHNLIIIGTICKSFVANNQHTDCFLLALRKSKLRFCQKCTQCIAIKSEISCFYSQTSLLTRTCVIHNVYYVQLSGAYINDKQQQLQIFNLAIPNVAQKPWGHEL